MNPWQLPRQVTLEGVDYPHRSDFREIIPILGVLGDEGKLPLLRWYMALELFYEKPIPRQQEQAAMEYLSAFLTCGEPAAPGPKLLDWQHDGSLIIGDVNVAAGRELRSEAYVHWWTFLSCFHGIGQGRLSTVVAIRDKLSRGQKLESWEQDYLQNNRKTVLLPTPETPADAAEKARLRQLLGIR